MSLLQNPNLIPFKQLGYTPSKVSGNQVIGDCPFCDGELKLYMNPVTKMWDCKSCTRDGGFKTFLAEAATVFEKKFTGKVALDFAKSRSLPLKVLKAHYVGYNPSNKTIILPIRNSDGSEIWDIRVYTDKKFMSLSGCHVGLFGWDSLPKSYDTIWLCEGEWDKMALEVMLAEKNITDPVVAVPGAGTFKPEWGIFFEGKTVNVMYDNDLPGKKGANKVNKILMNLAKTLNFVHWPATKKDKYDVRDYLIETEKKTFGRLANLTKLFKNEPPFFEDTKRENGKSPVVTASGKAKVDKYSGDYVDRKKIHEGYRKWLYLPDTDVLDVMFGTCIANRLDGDPLWLFLIAPPGGTKTELLNTISSGPNIVTTSSLTPKSLVSGANIAGGGDPSLIPRLDQKVLVVKDFTTILNMNPMLRDEIFAILRDAYDGKTEKDFGNGVRRSFVSKFGIISGVTPAIDLYTEGNTSLGERFLRFNIAIPESSKARHEYLHRAEENAGKELIMRGELAELGASVLNHDFTNVPVVTPDIKNKTIALAQFTAKMRGTVNRDKFTREITHAAFSELGTRIVKQYTKLMYGIGMYRYTPVIDESIYKIVKRMALSTVPVRLEHIVRHMYSIDPEREFTTEEIAKELKLQGMTCARLLENLDMLGIIDQHKQSMLKTSWTLNEDGIYLIEEGKIYS